MHKFSTIIIECVFAAGHVRGSFMRISAVVSIIFFSLSGTIVLAQEQQNAVDQQNSHEQQSESEHFVCKDSVDPRCMTE